MRSFTAFLLLSAFAAVGAAPQASPPFTIQRVGGGAPVRLADYRGKIVALAFVSTTCPHCQELTKELVGIAREYEPRGVQILECAFNPEAQKDLPGFIRQFAVTFPVGYSDRDAVYAYLGRSAVDNRPFYVPHLVFIDRAGIIRGDFAGESDFMAKAPANTRKELDLMLKAPTSPPPAAAASSSAPSGKR